MLQWKLIFSIEILIKNIVIDQWNIVRRHLYLTDQSHRSLINHKFIRFNSKVKNLHMNSKKLHERISYKIPRIVNSQLQLRFKIVQSIDLSMNCIYSYLRMYRIIFNFLNVFSLGIQPVTSLHNWIILILAVIFFKFVVRISIFLSNQKIIYLQYYRYT